MPVAGGKLPPEDLKLPEWQVFSNPDSAAENRDFKLKRVAPPKGFETFFEDTVLVERIREVRALLGFTRIESNADFAEATVLKDGRLTKLCRESPRWLPASEVRGEGIFLRIREEVFLTWQNKPEVQQLQQEFLDAHKAWRKLRKLEPLSGRLPRYSAGAAAFTRPCTDAPDRARLRLHRGQRARAPLLAPTWRGWRPDGRHPALHRRTG